MELQEILRDKARKFEAMAEALTDPDVAATIREWAGESIGRDRDVTTVQATLERVPATEPQPAPVVQESIPFGAAYQRRLVRRTNRRGMLARVMRAMHRLGIASIAELVSDTRLSEADVVASIHQMKGESGYGYLCDDGRVNLSPLGVRVAAYLVDHPSTVTLSGAVLRRLSRAGVTGQCEVGHGR